MGSVEFRGETPRDPQAGRALPAGPQQAATSFISQALKKSLQSWCGRAWDGLVECLPIGVYVCDHDGVIVHYNERAAQLWGRSPALQHCSIRLCGAWRSHQADGAPLAPSDVPMGEVLRTRQPVHNREIMLERPDGSRVTILVNLEPLFGDDGEFLGVVNLLTDITARKKAEERQQALLDELNHRVKNTLATVQSLASQTFRRHSGTQALSAFEARLLALSRTHDQLALGRWESADFGAILRDVMKPFREPFRDGRPQRVVLEGDPVELAPRVALTLAMVLHELASNAAQFGALSSCSGALQVSWRCEQDGEQRHLHIDWRESGGPAVRSPERIGFGGRLMKRGVEAELRGSTLIRFEPDGVRCSMRVPLRAT